MLYLKPSPIHGVGVFTTSALRIGTPLRLFSGDWRRRPTNLRGRAASYCTDRWAPKNFGRMAIGWYLNHSGLPNVEAKGEGRVIRYIPAGGELTVDYGGLE